MSGAVKDGINELGLGLHLRHLRQREARDGGERGKGRGRRTGQGQDNEGGERGMREECGGQGGGTRAGGGGGMRRREGREGQGKVWRTGWRDEGRRRTSRAVKDGINELGLGLHLRPSEAEGGRGAREEGGG